MSRWDGDILHFIGLVEITFAVLMLFPIVISLFYGDDPWIFIKPIPALLILGLTQSILFRSTGNTSVTGGIFLMASAWVVSFFVSIMPFYFSGYTPVEAVFEGISCFTTTGSTLVDTSTLPHNILFWRAYMQWIGGISVVLIFMFLLPVVGLGGRALTNNEISGSGSSHYSMRLASAVKNFALTYVVLSMAEFILLLICNVDIFNSICISMTTISTGGLANHTDGLASYSSMVKLIVTIFMFLGGTNFYLHYRALYKRDFKAYVQNQEFIWTFIWFSVCSVAVFTILGMNFDYIQNLGIRGTLESALDVVFTVVAFGTSAGFAVVDYTVWPVAAVMFLWLVGLFGAMSGSTAGGIKIYRMIVIRDIILNGLKRILHPNMYSEVKLNGETVEKNVVTSIVIVFTLFLLLNIASMVVLMILEPGMTFENAMGLALSSLNNIGSGFGDFGPNGSFAVLSSPTLMFMAFMMWLGRMEIVLVVIMFTKIFWQDLIHTRRSARQEYRITKFRNR